MCYSGLCKYENDFGDCTCYPGKCDCPDPDNFIEPEEEIEEKRIISDIERKLPEKDVVEHEQ